MTKFFLGIERQHLVHILIRPFLSRDLFDYGRKEIQECVVEGLKKYSNFKVEGEDTYDYMWVDGKYRIYLTIV